MGRIGRDFAKLNSQSLQYQRSGKGYKIKWAILIYEWISPLHIPPSVVITPAVCVTGVFDPEIY